MSSLFITINEITLTNQVHVLSYYININTKNQYGCAEKKSQIVLPLFGHGLKKCLISVHLIVNMAYTVYRTAFNQYF